MLNHTYTSVNNANLVDCGRKQHIPSQPFPLIKDNYLGEFRTELDKKKVLANLGIATSLSLEWEYIKGDIGRSEALIQELDSRTKYISEIDGFEKNIIQGIKYLEGVIKNTQSNENTQNSRIEKLESDSKSIIKDLSDLKIYLTDTIDVDLNKIKSDLNTITEKVNNITDLIQVSTKENNALTLLSGEYPGLYVTDLSEEVLKASENISYLQTDVSLIQEDIKTFVTRDELGGGDFDFVSQGDFDTYVNQNDEKIENLVNKSEFDTYVSKTDKTISNLAGKSEFDTFVQQTNTKIDSLVNQDDFDNYIGSTDSKLSEIEEELKNTVKTGEDGHVDTLYVNTISKNNDDSNIKITDSFEVESGIPLDVRFVVKSLDELHALNPSVCYPGMGVVVSDQASLYILREPTNGIIDVNYVKDDNGINWKCPEDLVIEVLTQEEYNKKVEENSINPNMFYYIHEEVTEEPNRKDFSSDEAYLEALNRWLRVLQQKYMSAVWGKEIEELVSSKASNTAIKSLETEIQRLSALIESLSGGSSGVNLKDLDNQVSTNTSNINTLIEEDGIIPIIQNDLSNLQNTVTSDYVTKEEITSENPDVEYIFVKKTAFETYKKEHEQQIEKEIVTDKITTSKVLLTDNTLTSNENDLLFNDEKVALNKQVPVIEVIDNASYEALSEKDPKTYYYVYDEDERYVLDSEFSDYKSSQSGIISTLSESININKREIGDLSVLSTENGNTLVYAINELSTKIQMLLVELEDLKNRVSKLESV